MQSIKLRPANWNDAEQLLKWKNDPVMREFSIASHEEIKMDDHLKWLAKHLNDIYIITDGEIDYGDIRFEADEIAIKLDPEYRGMGIGNTAIKLAQEMRSFIIAHIVVRNIASLNLFIKNGFRFITYVEDGYYILIWKR